MRDASVFCTMANGFMAWIGGFSGRSISSNDCVIPLTPLQQNEPDHFIEESMLWWNNRGVIQDGRKRFFFVGSLSGAFDFHPLVIAARKALDDGENWQFVICGDGVMADQVRVLFTGMSNVVFSGWVDRPKISALAAISIAGLAPYRNTDDFSRSIPNKIFDYLSLGKPILSPLKGEVAALINHYNVGFVYGLAESEDLFGGLKRLCSDDDYIAEISRNALKTYNDHFSGEKAYGLLLGKLVDLSKGPVVSC
jgi:glycosyltransferase involved in cell wall biosynthesis